MPASSADERSGASGGGDSHAAVSISGRIRAADDTWDATTSPRDRSRGAKSATLVFAPPKHFAESYAASTDGAELESCASAARDDDSSYGGSDVDDEDSLAYKTALSDGATLRDDYSSDNEEDDVISDSSDKDEDDIISDEDDVISDEVEEEEDSEFIGDNFAAGNDLDPSSYDLDGEQPESEGSSNYTQEKTTLGNISSVLID